MTLLQILGGIGSIVVTLLIMAIAVVALDRFLRQVIR